MAFVFEMSIMVAQKGGNSLKTKFSICAFLKQNMSRSCEVLEQKGGASAADGLSSF